MPPHLLLRQHAPPVVPRLVVPLRGQRHVPLRVDRVVEEPVGGRGHDGAAREHLLLVPLQDAQGGVAPVGPAPDADARAVEVWIRVQEGAGNLDLSEWGKTYLLFWLRRSKRCFFKKKIVLGGENFVLFAHATKFTYLLAFFSDKDTIFSFLYNNKSVTLAAPSFPACPL